MSTERKLHRFNLQFNANDPIQKYAYDALMLQGRHKSDFIARAIKFYTANSPEAHDPQLGGPIDNAYLKDIITVVMSEMQREGKMPPLPASQTSQPKPAEVSSPSPKPAPAAVKPEPQPTVAESPSSTDEPDHSDNDKSIDFALDALDAF